LINDTHSSSTSNVKKLAHNGQGNKHARVKDKQLRQNRAVKDENEWKEEITKRMNNLQERIK